MARTNVMIAMPLGEFGGGAEQMLYNYLLYRSSDSPIRLFMLFLSPGGLANAVASLGYPSKVLSAGRGRDVARLLATQRRVSRQMAEWNIDHVLAWMPKACAYVTLPAKVRGIPLLIWRHDIPTSLDLLDRLTLRYGRPTSVACSSEAAYRALTACGISGFNSHFVYPGVAPVTFEANSVHSIRHQILQGQKGYIVGTVTRLQPWKRVDLFLRAVADLKLKIPNVKVLVVGGESHGLSKGYGDQLKSLGKQLLGDDVIFVGEQRKVGDWLHAMDVFALPSSGEPFGIALVEALLAGKPVIACAGGGPEEIIRADSMGILLPASPTPHDMAVALEKLLDPASLSMARIANPISAARFSPDKMAMNIDQWVATAID